MPLDTDLYRRTILAPSTTRYDHVRRLSVIDIHPESATHTLVFVHGYGGRALQWNFQLQRFGESDRVIAPDLRGHGLSNDAADPPIGIESLVSDLELILDRLAVSQPVALIAHSFGGAIAVEYAIRHPERVSALVLIGVPTRFIVRPLARRLMRIPAAIMNPIIRQLKIALYAPIATLRRFHDHAMALWQGEQRMPLVQSRALVVMGQRDRVFMREQYEEVPRLIPHALQVVIPVSAHLVQLERPDAVNRAIRRFLDAKPQQAPITAPKAFDGKGEALAIRRLARPWLQAYDKDVPDDLPIPRMPLGDLVANAAREFPERPALRFFGETITYRELDRQSNRFAHALRKIGVQPGERVAILLPNIPQSVIAFYGALKAGAVVVLGSPLFKEDEIAFQLRDSGAQILLTLANYRATVERVADATALQGVIFTDAREYLPLRQRVPLAGAFAAVGDVAGQLEPGERSTWPTAIKQWNFQRLLRSNPPVPLADAPASEDLALLQYTSGTVDPSKGVMLTHANLLVNVAQVRHWVPDLRRGRETLLCALPLSHSYGITSALHFTIAIGGSLVLLPTPRVDAILAAIKRHRPGFFPGIPSLYLAIANTPHVRSYGVSSVRICISGSAPLPVELQEAFEKLTRGRLVEGYGLTEAAPVTHCNPLQGERRVGSIGIPMPGTDARVIDLQTGDPLPPGEVGELLIRGPQVMRGYWNRPAETAAALQDGWLHTGDLARMDDEGFFAIVERKKDMILAGPYNVYPREIEEVLYEHPKVLEVAVVGSPGTTNGAGATTTDGAHGVDDDHLAPATTPIKAYVVLKRGERATQDELLALCRERLDAYKVPRQIEFRTELPKNFIGKVLRRLLVEAP